MIKFNHVTIKDDEGRDIICDSNYRFKEGVAYIFDMPKKSSDAVFDCINNTRKTDEGIITSWSDELVYSPLDERYLPTAITGEEFLRNVRIPSGKAYEPVSEEKIEEAEKLSGLKEEVSKLVKEMSDIEKARLRAAAFLIAEPEIVLFRPSLPEVKVIKNIRERLGADATYFFAVQSKEEVKDVETAFKESVRVISLSDKKAQGQECLCLCKDI